MIIYYGDNSPFYTQKKVEELAVYGVYTSTNTVPTEQLLQSIPHPPVSKQKDP